MPTDKSRVRDVLGFQTMVKSPNQSRDTSSIGTRWLCSLKTTVANLSSRAESTTRCFCPASSVSVKIAGRFRVRTCAQEPRCSRQARPAFCAWPQGSRSLVIAVPHSDNNRRNAAASLVLALFAANKPFMETGEGRGLVAAEPAAVEPAGELATVEPATVEPAGAERPAGRPPGRT